MTATVKAPRKTLPGVVTRSKWRPPKLCMFGTPGIGKSTFGAGAPNAIFIPTEAGVENLDVARFPVAETLGEFFGHLSMVAEADHDHGAVVIDTLNGLADLYRRAMKDVVGDRGKPLYDFVGFGGSNGWKGVAHRVKEELLPLLNKCQRRGMYVILLAHTGDYTRKNPLGDDLVVAAPSIAKWVWAEIHGDMDVIGRADYVYSIVAKNGQSGKAKVSTDEEMVDGVKVKVRELSFEGRAEQDCKVRVGYELPAKMPLSWDAFASSLGNVKAMTAEIRGLWRHMPDEAKSATLNWLGVSGLDDLHNAGRSKLSQLRNRLLELEAVAVPEDAETPEQIERSTETTEE